MPQLKLTDFPLMSDALNQSITYHSSRGRAQFIEAMSEPKLF